MNNMISILVIEDDSDISNMICDLLKQHGYNTKQAHSGTEALMIFDNEIDLVLLDLMLPGVNGELVLQEIRKHSNIPVIGLSAKSDKASTVNLLKSGADDYIVKPFNNDELLARIEAQLRRYKQSPSLPVEINEITYKDITIDMENHAARVKDIPLSLTIIYVQLYIYGRLCKHVSMFF